MDRTTTASRVFVTQENANLNYSPAEQFGEIVFLTRDDVSHVPGSLINSSIVSEMKAKLATFNNQLDFLAPSGSPIVCGIAFMLLEAQRCKYPIRVLRWSNRDHVYHPVSITL